MMANTRSASLWIWWTRGNFVRSSPTLMSVLASLDQDLALLAGDRLCHVDNGDHDSLWNWWYIFSFKTTCTTFLIVLWAPHATFIAVVDGEHLLLKNLHIYRHVCLWIVWCGIKKLILNEIWIAIIPTRMCLLAIKVAVIGHAPPYVKNGGWWVMIIIIDESWSS